MFEKAKNENILFLDIETAAQVHKYNDLDERQKHLWAAKIHYIAERDNKSAEELFNKAAIWAEFGKIICISVGYLITEQGNTTLRVKSFYGHNEKHLLENFSALLTNHFNKEKHILCAHNGKEFDFPYISRRFIINNIPLPKQFANWGKKPWEIKHLDTLELWKFGDHKHYTSLDLLTAILGIPSPKNQIDGSMVNHIYWEENDLQKIAGYCQKDVIAVCKVFLKFKNSDINESLHIEIVSPSIAN